ncbi:maestro heat-like repeat-containing protein family member 9 [Manis pentadactyla]|uniref:maestro heat-like repeat-containing protein family member 9 n=1 Tax=Manis pentadactyla TaxID=143292 RepID=UPI00255CABFD|nr:maestro heat-like repeat-containing protein family member 9 [Manis pentadactyla]
MVDTDLRGPYATVWFSVIADPRLSRSIQEHMASCLLDIYSDLLDHQAIILAVNSSFVDPLLQFESQLKIIEKSFKMVFSVPNLDEVKDRGNSQKARKDLETLYCNILNIYEATLLILVSEDLYKLQILKEMATWMREDSRWLHERALVIISRVLSSASCKVRGSASVDAPCLGVLAAELSLLCSHTDPSITQQAFLGMYHLLCIAKFQSDIEKNKTTMCKPRNHCLSHSPSEMEFLPKILQRDKTKFAQIIGQSLQPSLLTDFVWTLLMTLSTADGSTASKAATLLQLTLEHHTHKVTAVSKIVDAIYKQLCRNSSHVVKDAMLRIITLLTRTYPKMVIFQLMDCPVPADQSLVLMWHAAGSESSVAPHMLQTILLILKGKPGQTQDSPMEKRRFSMDAANMMPVVACQALCTLLPMKSYRKTVAQFFPQLLMALLLQLFYSSSLRLTTGERPLFAQDALRALLSCSGLQQVDCALERRKLWSQCSHELSHHHGVHLIAKTLSEYRFPQFPQTLQYLYKLSVEGPRMSKHSIITVTFLMELLNNFFKDPLPEEFMILFRNWVNDSNPAVCKLSLRKIASMAPVINEIENVCSLLISILDAFLSKDKTVVIQALFTLRTLLGKLDKVTYSSLCTRIASGYCPLMDHDSGSIRSMAVQQLGKLLRDMSQHKSMLRHVVLRGLVPLILFLEDTETRVVRACKFTLEICASELNWSMPHLLKDKQYSFDLVVLDICKNVLISHGSCIMDLIYDTLGFLRSSQPYLKRASIILIGYLTKLGGHLLLKDEVKIMLDAVDQVLQDEDPVIRELAEITSNIIKEIAHMLTSSIFKQSFRRLFNCIYIKKLKPLYNCDWSSKQSDGEALPYEAHEDFLTKSSRFTGAQGRTSEEGTHSSPS